MPTLFLAAALAAASFSAFALSSMSAILGVLVEYKVESCYSNSSKKSVVVVVVEVSLSYTRSTSRKDSCLGFGNSWLIRSVLGTPVTPRSDDTATRVSSVE
jgi:hypothetical protein